MAVFVLNRAKPRFSANLNDNSWEQIFLAAREGKASKLWKLGDSKILTLTDEVMGQTNYEMQIVDFNKDAPNTITFISKYCSTGQSAFSEVDAKYETSLYKQYCQQIYNNCDAKPYIKKLKKLVGTDYHDPVMDQETIPDGYTGKTISDGTDLITLEEFVWVPSASELGFSYQDNRTDWKYAYDYHANMEYTQGVTEPYLFFYDAESTSGYSSNTTRKKTQPDGDTGYYRTRSRSSYSDGGYVLRVNTTGIRNDSTTFSNTGGRLVFGLTIG